MAEHKHDTIISRFLENEGGAIVYLSDDSTFTRMLRNIVSRDIGFKGDALFSYSSTVRAREKCHEFRDNGVPCVIFIERKLNDRPTTDFIIALRKECPDLRMIVLTWEATQETVAYFFELGVSRVLVKPASANKIIEELSATINPPGELKDKIAHCEELLESGEYDEALEMTDRILMLKPDLARGLTMRGDAYMGIGKTEEAVQSYMAAHEAKPIFMAPLNKLADALKGMDDERALECMKTLDEISPLNPERKIEIAEQHLRRNETEEAEAYLDKGVEVAEQETGSMASDFAGRIADVVAGVAPHLAVKYLNRVIENRGVLGRDDLVHFNRLGILLRGQGKWSEAVDVYDKALEIVNDDPIVHYNKGLAYWEGNERTKALQCFETALDLDPMFYSGSVGAALNIGSLYLDMRHFEDAVPFLQHALDLDPKNKIAKKRLNDANNHVAPQRKSDGGYDMDSMVGKKGTKMGSGEKGSKSGKAIDVDSLAEDTPSKHERRKRTGSKVTKLDF